MPSGIFSSSIQYAIILWMILGLSSTALAQSSSSVYQPRVSSSQMITVDDGLSHRSVTDVLQDKQGFLWISTKNGLNRYDGHNIVNYTNQPSNDHKINSSWIIRMYLSEQGHLVLLNNQERVEVLDPTTDKRLVLDPGALISPRSDIRGAHQSKDGNIYIIVENESGYTLMRYVDSSFEVVWQINEKRTSTVDLIDIYNIRFPFFKDDTGAFWILDTEQGLKVIDAAGNLIKHFKFTDFEGLSMMPDLYANRTCIVQDAAGRIWLSFGSVPGLYLYDHKTEQFNLQRNHSNDYVLNAFTDMVGNLIFLSEEKTRLSASATLVDTSGQHIDYSSFFEFISINDFIKSNDFTDQIYQAVNEGLYQVNFKTNTVGNFLDEQTLRGGIGRSIRGIIQLDNDDILIASESEGWFRLMAEQNTVEPLNFPNQPVIELQKPVATRNFIKDDNGYIWTCSHRRHIAPETPGGYLLRYDQQSNTIKSYETQYRAEHVILNGNEIWLVGNHKIIIFDILTEAFRGYRNTDGSNPIDGMSAFVIRQSDDGLFWIATDKGLVSVNTKNGTSSQTMIKNSTGSTPLTDHIIALRVDERGLLLLGTLGSGFLIYNPDDGSLSSYTESIGLADDNVCGIIPDTSGNYWLATYNGLSYFNTRDNSFRNYYTTDGFTHNEFNRCANLSTNNGTLYLGGMNGVNAFVSEDLLQLRPVPNLFMSNMTRRDKENNEIVSSVAELESLQRLTLPAENKYVSIRMAIDDYSKSKLNRYAYFLEGYDKDWQQLINTNQVILNNLPSGKYILHLKGANHRGQWTDVRTIEVKVTEFFYKSVWFYLVLLGIGMIGLYALYRYRVNQINKMMELRTKIASDLHDEVGGILTGIAMQSEILELGKAPQSTKTLSHIRELSRNAITSMRDVVWSIDNRKNKLADLLDRVREFAEELFYAKDIQFSIEVSSLNEDRELDSLVRQNLYLIIKEALTNTVRYADADSCLVQLRNEAGRFELWIKDNGRGHDATSRSAGLGLSNIRMRAEQLNAKVEFINQEGFGIRISMKQL